MNTLIIAGIITAWMLLTVGCYGYQWRYVMRGTRYDNSERCVMRVMIAISSMISGMLGPFGVLLCIHMCAKGKHGWGFAWEPSQQNNQDQARR